MMEFLKSIMESQYFPIGIFALIAILAIIFLILLLGGKKKDQIIDKSSFNEKISNDDLVNGPIISGPDEADSIIEPVKEFSPEEFHPEEIIQSGEHVNNANVNVFDTPAPIIENNKTVNSDIEPVVNQNPMMFNAETNNPVFEPKEIESISNLTGNQEIVNPVQMNENQFNSVFVNKLDESTPTEIVSPKPIIDLPKLNSEVEVKEEISSVENEIQMPTAEAPRPFDIENKDL